ncbi:MBL fold metallo-hydrolase [Roseiconus lacunae]|uniref:MBL fold metallo-hydrolase n=1 Tax=Roseiconus lacunae TaxID=2605694 RepID=UPI001E640575|nr:MBL fold metallo-hydrolase [Roseiconus lacunae]MCD0461924.1 MBL fold metallo-hydrolase [Roseiconus lacunae]
MKLQNLRFHNGGYCIQNLYFSGVKSFRYRRFYAVFLQFDHPVHGACLIDTGYGPAIREATRRWPFRVMRWLTPLPRNQGFFRPDYPADLGIDAEQPFTIFLSHFHADHIGATQLFPNSSFVYRDASLRQLRSMSPRQQLDEATVISLLPDDFEQRGRTIDESSFTNNHSLCEEFPSFDYWGDGSLIMIDLPGHAIGHTGYLLSTDRGTLLYAVDAFWDRSVFEADRQLPWLSKRILHDAAENQVTLERLRTLVARTGVEPLACHCPQTQSYV